VYLSGETNQIYCQDAKTAKRFKIKFKRGAFLFPERGVINLRDEDLACESSAMKAPSALEALADNVLRGRLTTGAGDTGKLLA
jgi:hypothetical protein